MKKTLIAAAALAVSAGAMAEVTVYGTIDATLRMSDNGTVKTTAVGRDGSGTTGLYIKFSEDLGDGLKAIGLYEHDFNFEQDGQGANAASNDGTGERYVGLQGGFGAIKLGIPNAPSLTVQSGLRGAPFGTKDGGRGAAGGDKAAATGLFGKNLTRYNNSMVYESPSFSGFSFALDYVPESGDGRPEAPVQPAVTDIGVFYKNGPLWIGVTSWSQAESLKTTAVAAGPGPDGDFGTPGDNVAASTTYGVNVEESLLSFGVHYNFGFATFGLGGHKYSKDGKDENSGFNVIAAVPLSDQLTLGANFQSLTDDREGVTDANTNDATQIAVGVNYQLSKSTSVYARYVSLTPDKTGADTVTTTLAGLRVNY